MSYLSIDKFIEAFAAVLVERGQRSIRLNDENTRVNLESVYQFLNKEIESEQTSPEIDKMRLRSLYNLRNIFRPSAIGAFDQFEALMRTKQDYLTEHPNPYYHDINLRLTPSSAKKISQRLAPATSDFVNRAVDSYAESPER